MRLVLFLLLALVLAPAALAAPQPKMPVDGGGGDPAPPELYADAGASGSSYEVSPAEAYYGYMGDADYSDAYYCCVPAGERCAHASWEYHAGVWPYRHQLWLDSYWCWWGSTLTYRRSHSWQQSGPGCGPEGGVSTWRSGGGVGAGHAFVDVHADQSFGCPIFWGLTVHDTLWMEVRYSPYARSDLLGAG